MFFPTLSQLCPFLVLTEDTDVFLLDFTFPTRQVIVSPGVTVTFYRPFLSTLTFSARLTTLLYHMMTKDNPLISMEHKMIPQHTSFIPVTSPVVWQQLKQIMNKVFVFLL